MNTKWYTTKEDVDAMRKQVLAHDFMKHTRKRQPLVVWLYQLLS